MVCCGSTYAFTVRKQLVAGLHLHACLLTFFDLVKLNFSDGGKVLGQA
jgi:hypothetical protein